MDGEPEEAPRDGVGLSSGALAPKLAYTSLDATREPRRVAFACSAFSSSAWSAGRNQESVAELVKAIEFTMAFLEGSISDNDVGAIDNAVGA